MNIPQKVKFDQTVGYSPLNLIDSEKKITEANNCKQIIESHYVKKDEDKLLVAGTGNGEEARLISKVFKIKTYGVDINEDLSYQPGDRENLFLFKQDLTHLGFLGNSFSIIYCYHVLEHILNHENALMELYRVLEPGGILFIGFPNKNRLFSYFGTSQKATILEKIKWNFNDYWMRIVNKFDNKYGAHAGFTEKEFTQSNLHIFKNIYPIRNEYMLTKYERHKILIRFIITLGLSEVLFPSNYFICRK